MKTKGPLGETSAQGAEARPARRKGEKTPKGNLDEREVFPSQEKKQEQIEQGIGGDTTEKIPQKDDRGTANRFQWRGNAKNDHG